MPIKRYMDLRSILIFKLLIIPSHSWTCQDQKEGIQCRGVVSESGQGVGVVVGARQIPEGVLSVR